MDKKVLRAYNVHFYNLFKMYSDKYTVYIDIETYPPDVLDMDDTTILSVAMKVPDPDEGKLRLEVFYGDEKKILENINRTFYNLIFGRIVGYGIMYYDIPLLVMKARKYNLKTITRVLSIVTPLDLSIPTAIYFYVKTKEFRMYSLKEAVAKLELDSEYQFSDEIFKDIHKLVEYNVRDLENVKKLHDFLKNVYENRNFINDLKL